MKILIADKFPEHFIPQFEEMGLDVDYSPKLGEDDIPNHIKDVDILVVRSTKVNAKTISEGNELDLIIRAGAGVNNIDIPAANEKGVYVANCPGKNSIAVAELVIGLMIALDRRIAHNVMDFKAGKWNKAEYSKAEGLSGKTMAIVGVGNIGKEVAKRALAMGMNVYGKDVSRIEGVAIKDFSEMDKILPIADVITIHLPLTNETRNLFDDKMFEYVKPGAIFINASRAEIVNEDSLIKAIKEKNLKVGLDVFKNEPESKAGSVTSPLQELDNVYITHHIGASTEQAQNAIAEETVKIIKDFMNSGVIAHWVNKSKPIANYQLVIKHYDRPGVLLEIFNTLNSGGINIEEVENVIFEGGIAASCTMRLNKPATQEMLAKFRSDKNVMNVSHVEL